MAKLVQALLSLAKSSARASGAIVIGVPALWLIWPPSGPVGIVSVVVWVMSCAVLLTYFAEWLWKQARSYWNSRCWLSDLAYQPISERRRLRYVLENGGAKPYWIWRTHWKYLLKHPELIETPGGPRDKRATAGKL